MVAVPYSPVPSVSPSSGGTPYLRVPGGVEEAAGGTTAKALGGLGRSVDQVGDVLEKHVLALQNLQNETDAKNADVDVMVKIGQAQSEFDQLEGDNAVKALPGHMERIKAIRTEALDAMPNAVARKMLDQSISRRVGFSIVDSGNRAGTQAKVASKAARQARVETAKSTFDPANPKSADAAWRTIESEIDQAGEEMGAKPETIDNIKRKEYSQMWLNGFSKIAQTKPQLANDLFEEQKDKLDPAVREQAQKLVNSGMATKQTWADADAIFKKKGFDPQKGPGQLEPILAEAKKYAEKYKDNPDYERYLDARIRTQFNVGMQGYRDTQNGFKYSLGNFILGQNDQGRVVDLDGVIGPKAPPEMRQAFNALEPADKSKVLGWIKSASSMGAIRMTPERMRKFMELKGKASDPETREEFYNMGPEAIYEANLPWAETKQLLTAQEKLKNPITYNALQRSMGAVTGMLDAAGITKTKDAEGYYQFRGAMEDQVNTFVEEHKKQPNPEESRKIASRLLQDQTVRWFRANDKVFNAPVPDDHRKEIVEALKTKGFENPTEAEVQRMYAYKLYKDLYDKSTKPSKGDKK